MNYIIEKRDPGCNWYRYSVYGNEYSAICVAENGKRAFPTSSFRVVDSKGGVRFIL